MTLESTRASVMPGRWGRAELCFASFGRHRGDLATETAGAWGPQPHIAALGLGQWGHFLILGQLVLLPASRLAQHPR